MNRSRLFIASSTESKWLAEKILSIVNDELDVKIMDQNTFYTGYSSLQSLRRQILWSDFALLIVYPDDEVVIQQGHGYTTRDNIFYELGFFTGALGWSRCFYLVIIDRRHRQNKEIHIPSNLNGPTRLSLTLEDDINHNESILRHVCIELKDAIRKAKDGAEILLLPSTSLAIGYFNNFVVPVCQALSETRHLTIANRSIDFTDKKYELNIVLPVKAFDQGFLKFIGDLRLQRAEIKPTGLGGRMFPLFVDISPQGGEIKFYDCPTTLRAAWEAVEKTARYEPWFEKEELLRREIRNFENTLYELLKEEPKAAAFRENIKIHYLNELTNNDLR